jgi:superfamily II DNA or RNA helicase
VELLKIPIFLELAKDALAEGNSVAIFVNFTATLNAIVDRMEFALPVSLVRGAQTEEARKESVSRFQSNDTKVMICMIQAGGVGLSLHDLHGGHPRVSIISPSFSAVELRQTLGRIHRAGSLSPAVQKIVFVRGTVEMNVCRSIKSKLNNLDLINDDELNPIL